MKLSQQIVLCLFGWHTIHESFVPKGIEYIKLSLRENGIGELSLISPKVFLALSQLAFVRAAKTPGEDRVRWRDYMRELDRAASIGAEGLRGRDINDGRIRSILQLHQAGPPD